MVDRVKYHPYFHKSRVKPLQFAKNFTHHSPGILGQAKSKGWPENLKQQKSKLIALHTVDGSEIPRPTTWDGAKTLVNKGRNGSQPQLVSCSRISLHHQLCMVPAASLSGKQQLSIFFGKTNQRHGPPLKRRIPIPFQGAGRDSGFSPSSRPASWRWNLESFPPRWAPPSAHRRSKESKARRPFGQGCQRRSCRPRRTWKKIGGTAGGKRILLLVVIGGVLLSQYILHFGGRKRDRFFSTKLTSS